MCLEKQKHHCFTDTVSFFGHLCANIQFIYFAKYWTFMYQLKMQYDNYIICTLIPYYCSHYLPNNGVLIPHHLKLTYTFRTQFDYEWSSTLAALYWPTTAWPDPLGNILMLTINHGCGLSNILDCQDGYLQRLDTDMQAMSLYILYFLLHFGPTWTVKCKCRN